MSNYILLLMLLSINNILQRILLHFINSSVSKILESALVASKRNGLIREEHLHEGAVIGATRDALMQVSTRANGQSVGGKIGIARKGEHISVCIFLSIGLLHLDEVVIGIGHRALPE